VSTECTKALPRRLRDPAFAAHYFVGRGLDVGAGPDGLSAQRAHWPKMGPVRDWDVADGDGQELPGIEPCTFDFVHSSHCLEHLHQPSKALARWLEVTRYGGYVVALFPDEDLYEQGMWPSTYNMDHKWTFTTFKAQTWSPRSLNVVQLVTALRGQAELVKLELLHATFDWQAGRRDQTAGAAESAIELVLRRRSPEEIERGGRIPA
jgi:SAM-dependent methyltransferase